MGRLLTLSVLASWPDWSWRSFHCPFDSPRSRWARSWGSWAPQSCYPGVVGYVIAPPCCCCGCQAACKACCMQGHRRLRRGPWLQQPAGKHFLLFQLFVCWKKFHWWVRIKGRHYHNRASLSCTYVAFISLYSVCSRCLWFWKSTSSACLCAVVNAILLLFRFKYSVWARNWLKL